MDVIVIHSIDHFNLPRQTSIKFNKKNQIWTLEIVMSSSVIIDEELWLCRLPYGVCRKS